MTSHPTLVSVVSPVYNEAKYIGQMLDSLQSQTYDAWEALLVDDGSSDDTVAIIESYAAHDDRIKLVHQGERLGKVRAFNKAFTAASGGIVCHVGGDDVATPDAMLSRVEALASLVETNAVAYFKLRMFSKDPTIGPVLPRGRSGSRSGGSTTLTMPLARRIFPVPGSLPSEDLWIGEGALGLATTVVHSRDIVLSFRVHPGNSNPRNKSYDAMSASIHARMRFAPALLDEPRFDLSEPVRDDLARQWRAEQLRVDGRTLAILRSDLAPVDRLGVAAMSNEHLWALRRRAYGLLSGWRRR